MSRKGSDEEDKEEKGMTWPWWMETDRDGLNGEGKPDYDQKKNLNTQTWTTFPRDLQWFLDQNQWDWMVPVGWKLSVISAESNTHNSVDFMMHRKRP